MCSSAYPDGIAQENREQAAPTFLVKYDLPFDTVDDTALDGHLQDTMNRTAEWSFTKFQRAYENTPNLIIELDLHERAGDRWDASVRVIGREDMHADDTPEGAKDARVLFLFHVGPDGLTALLASAGAEIAEYVTRGWTCDGDVPRHAPR
jgi:hypothetical protein